MKAWKRIKHDESHKVGWRHIVIKRFEMPDGQIQDYGIHDREGAIFVGVIALTPENKVVVARQFRPGPELIMDELPGGGANPGEDHKTAALRELLEETGYSPEGTVTELGITRKEAYRNAVHHYFLALECVKHSEANPDDGEFVEPHEISIQQLIHNAKSGEMTDPAAVLLALDRLIELIV